jgi:hypothetical protein
LTPVFFGLRQTRWRSHHATETWYVRAGEDMVLTASMIDGFGWFPEERYRRTLLLFDRIQYVLPNYVRGLMAPPWVYGQPDFEAIESPSDTGRARERLEHAERDTHDPEFRQLFELIPEDDAVYSLNVLRSDIEMQSSGRPMVHKPITAVSYLAEKLLDHCAAVGCVPVVGQDYAASILAFKSARRLTPLSSGSVLTGPQATALNTVAAGLSYAFVSDADLRRTTTERILRYKAANRELLDRHQLHLVSVAQRFAQLAPNEAQFMQEMSALRQQALAERMAMEQDAREAWHSAGFRLAERGLLVAGGGLITALGLIGSKSLVEVAATAVPAFVGASAFAAVQGLKAWNETRKARHVAVSYLVEAARELDAASGSAA